MERKTKSFNLKNYNYIQEESRKLVIFTKTTCLWRGTEKKRQTDRQKYSPRENKQKQGVHVK